MLWLEPVIVMGAFVSAVSMQYCKPVNWARLRGVRNQGQITGSCPTPCVLHDQHKQLRHSPLIPTRSVTYLPHDSKHEIENAEAPQS